MKHTLTLTVENLIRLLFNCNLKVIWHEQNVDFYVKPTNIMEMLNKNKDDGYISNLQKQSAN
jgi:hypothetical protein